MPGEEERDRLIDLLLREELGGEGPPDLAEKVLARAFGRRRRLVPWLAAAAASALFAVLAWALLGHAYPEPRASGRFVVSGGGEVQRGSVILTEGGGAALALGGYCRLELEPQSALRIEGAKRAEQVCLERGGVACDVDSKVGTFVVRADLGTVSVRGTRFVVRIVEVKGGEEMVAKKLFVKVAAGLVLVSGAWGERALAAGQERMFEAEQPQQHQLSGTVAMACPQGKFIKIRTEDGAEKLFPVAEAAQEAVRQLKSGGKVTATYIQCPKTGKDTVTKVERAEGPKPEEHQVAGTVVMACPQGKLIKIHAGDGSETLYPVAASAQEAVKQLKKGDKVTLTYIRCCPKAGKDTVIKAEKAS